MAHHPNLCVITCPHTLCSGRLLILQKNTAAMSMICLELRQIRNRLIQCTDFMFLKAVLEEKYIIRWGAGIIPLGKGPFTFCRHRNWATEDIIFDNFWQRKTAKKQTRTQR